MYSTAKDIWVTQEWRKLHNKELYDLNFSINVILERRGTYRDLVGRPEGKIPLGKPRRRWMLLKCVFKKWDGGHGQDYSGSR